MHLREAANINFDPLDYSRKASIYDCNLIVSQEPTVVKKNIGFLRILSMADSSRPVWQIKFVLYCVCPRNNENTNSNRKEAVIMGASLAIAMAASFGVLLKVKYEKKKK